MTSTIAAVLNRIGDVRIETEDSKLQQMLAKIAELLRHQHAKPTTKVRLRSIPPNEYDRAIQALIEVVALTHKYCEAVVASSEKQWEILAKRAGWTPPAA
jgi:hypothetical protein